MAEEREKDRGGNPEEEIGKYRAILDKDPKSRVFAPLAEAYRKAGLLDDAIDTARDGLTHHPSYLSGRVALARALFAKGEPDEARSEISQVVQSAPDNLMAHKLLGQIHLQGGNTGEAEKSFNMVLLLDPRDQEAQAALENIKTPPAHTPPPIESTAPAATSVPEVSPEEAGAAADGPAEEPEEAEALPEGLVFEGDDEGSPFDQGFDDLVESSAPDEDESEDSSGDISFALENVGAEEARPEIGTEGGPFDLETGEPNAAAVTVDDSATEAEAAPFDLGVEEDLEAVEPAAAGAVPEDDSAAEAEEAPFDLGGDEELEAVEPAAAGAVPEDDSAAEAEEAPFDLGGDEELEAVEPAAAGAVPEDDSVLEAEEAPFDLGVEEDLEAAEPAAAPAVTIDDRTWEAEDAPFDLVAEEDLNVGEPTTAAGVTEDNTAFEVEDVPFDLGVEEDLEAAEPAAAPAVTIDDRTWEAEDAPFDLVAEEDLNVGEPTTAAGVTEDNTAFEVEDVPFDLGVDEDLEAVEPPAADAVTEDASFDLGIDGELEEPGDFDVSPEAVAITTENIDETPLDRAEDLVTTAGAFPKEEEPAPGFEAPAATLPKTGAVEGDAFNTETLAHLYIKQGFYDKAAGVYEAMLQEKPDDLSLRQKLEEARSLAGMMAQAESSAVPAAEELTAPRPPVPEESPVAAAESGEHPAIVGLRRFLAQLKERQP